MMRRSASLATQIAGNSLHLATICYNLPKSVTLLFTGSRQRDQLFHQSRFALKPWRGAMASIWISGASLTTYVR
jgi:hypothetical protein